MVLARTCYVWCGDPGGGLDEFAEFTYRPSRAGPGDLGTIDGTRTDKESASEVRYVGRWQDWERRVRFVPARGAAVLADKAFYQPGT